MAVPTVHRKSARRVRRPVSALEPASPVPDPVAGDTKPATAHLEFTEDLIAQVRVLGLSEAAASRFLEVAQRALTRALAGLDRRALTAVPATEQISMLLPRFNVAALARASRLPRASVQSALAAMIIHLVTSPPRAWH